MTVAMFSLVMLASGYVFLRLWQLSRSHLVRSEGHTLYFLVVWSAFAIGLISIILCHDIFLIPFAGPSIQQFVNSALRAYITEEKGVENIVRFGTAALMSMPLSIILALILNVPLRASKNLCSSLLFRISSVTELECILWEATTRSLSVMITLSSGKVYVGNAIDAPSPGEEKKWIRIEPLLSGYRDDKQIFIVTTSYFWIYDKTQTVEEGVKPVVSSDFDVFIPVEGVQSVHSFDIETFEKRFNAVPAATEPLTSSLNGVGISQSPRLRPSSHRSVTNSEYVYFVYTLTLVASPFVIFAGWDVVGLCMLLFAFLIARLFHEVKKFQDVATKEGGQNGVA